MKKLKIIMIHEVHPWMLDLDLSEFDIITFDDGLYSQYRAYKHFLKFDKPLYFFISTDIVCPKKTKQNKDIVSCSESHKRFFENGDLSNYMKWSQIKEIYNTKNCYIGGHSNSHQRIKSLPLKEQSEIALNDVFIMISKFRENEIEISTFCYPYNEEILGYNASLKKFGIFSFFGKNRTPIEELIQ